MKGNNLSSEELGLLAIVFFRENTDKPVREFEFGVTSRGENCQIILSRLVRTGFLENREGNYFCTDKSKKKLLLNFTERVKDFI